MTFEESMENIKNRLDALTMNLELMSHQSETQSRHIADLIRRSDQDGEHIRALARIAEAHEHRLSDGGL